jgi:rhodanese-related sulfurtransferase
VKFILDNLLLVAIALVSGGLLLWPLLKKGGGSTSVSALEATQLINHRNAIVVDVREEKDFALGSLAGARNLPFAKLDERASELVRFKSRPVVIVCDAGTQSARAIATFKAQGFEEAVSLAGGVAAWRQASLPLVQPGRDNQKSAAREQPRKSKGDSRNRNSKPRDVAAVPVVAEVGANVSPNVSANDSIAAAEPVVAPDEAPPTPGRLKEIS